MNDVLLFRRDARPPEDTLKIGVTSSGKTTPD
jgi:hypothetical protein